MKRSTLFLTAVLLLILIFGSAFILAAQSNDEPPAPTPTPPPLPNATVTVDWANLVLPEHGEFASQLRSFSEPQPQLQQPSFIQPSGIQPNNNAGAETTAVIIAEYIVAPGDTIYAIARQFGITPHALIGANQLINPHLIHTGLILRIPDAANVVVPPAPPEVSPPVENGRYYTVAAGDSLFRIALRFSLTVDALIQANAISNPALIYPGTQLRIPDGTSAPPPAPQPQPPAQPEPAPAPPSGEQTYLVQQGDSLHMIARRFGVSVEAIAYYNNITNWAQISPGQLLNIPPADLVVPPPTQLPPSASGYIWPVDSRAIVKGFHYGHEAIDIVIPTGSDVLAIAAGTVEFAGWNNHGYGNLLVLNHGNGRRSLYAHNSEFLVAAGQEISQGQPIALSGNTGRSSMPHLHLEIMVDTFRYVNPCEHLPGGC